jgi:alkanesulfonate monooxygenase SsuD/methylene tetrahydromethanopterin reductase-like flavin-dependent oxidoreductase (luciferase family)
MRTTKARLVTGAVLPAFNDPLKVAGEIGMLDAISGGRLEVGFARAFLPHEFARFQVSLDDSRARFEEGVEQVRRLLEEEDVTSLPRPTQKPRPPFWIAALGTPESFIRAGRNGHGLMAIPLSGGQMAELTAQYREAWQSAGHPGRGHVMLAFHMFCHRDGSEAANLARGPLNRYLKTLTAAASAWTGGVSSADYPGYDKMIAAISKETFESQVAKGAAWVGSPQEVIEQVREYDRIVGGFEIASLQINFNTIGLQDAEASMRLFAKEVMPHFL